MARHVDAAERLGKLVRETWVEWAAEQPYPKPSWLVRWEDLDAGQREVDVRIGEAIVSVERERTADVIAAARHVVDNAYGTKPRHTRSRDGQGCRDDCIPCGLAALGETLADLDSDNLPARSTIRDQERAAVMAELPERIADALTRLELHVPLTGPMANKVVADDLANTIV